MSSSLKIQLVGYHKPWLCGSSSVVERLPSKQVVEGSIPFSRSIFVYREAPRGSSVFICTDFYTSGEIFGGRLYRSQGIVGSSKPD